MQRPRPPLKKKALLALSIALPLLAAAPSASAELRVEHIIWLSADPPSAKDSASNTGLTAQLVHFMTRQWPEVRHTIVQANARRAWQMLAQGEPACQASSVRTPEREKLAYFTNTLLGPPLQLIARRDKLDALPRNAAGEVDVERLLADPRLRGALVDGRSYGGPIDKLLARRPPNPALTLYAASDFGSKLLPMLAIDRADYSIEYDIALSQEREHNPQMSRLISLPIEGASEPMQVGVACPRNAWGLAAIRGIDKALGTPAGAAMLRQAGDRWLTPESRQHYGARMDAFYKERAKPSLIR